MKLNLTTRMFESNVPFDQVFVATIATDAPNTHLWIRYGLATLRGDDFDRAPSGYAEIVSGAEKVAALRIAPLRPRKTYRFEVCRTPPDATLARPCPETLLIPLLVRVPADISANFDSDFGLLWSPPPGPGYVGAGTNVHLYLVPINKSETARALTNTIHDEVLKRVSIFAGLAFVKLHATHSVESQFSGVGNLVTGLGLRPRTPRLPLLDFFRLNGGIMWFVQRDANPIVSHDHGKHAPFLSVTGDVALQGVLGPLAGLVGIRK